MPQLSVAALVELLGRHQLLDTERVAEIQRGAARFAEARELAGELIRRGWLTAFQVNQLFLDRGADLVVGQFVLLDRLGEGGMGQVFKAWQRNLQRIVALKLIRKECLNNPRIIQRFQREIRAAGQLAHPHIVHAYDAGQETGGYFIAMEYIEGLDLSRMVQQSGPLAVPRACDFLRQAALGLQHAYEHGLVHRDIKPANLLWTSGKGPASGLHRRPNLAGSGVHARPGSALLSRPGTFPWGIVKILDLGLARWISPDDGNESGHLTQLGAFMGTPDFMAPEQALNSHACDIRSDVYSLGCTFYYLLAGQAPFPGGSLTEKVMRHQRDEPEPVEEVRHRNLTSAPGLSGTSPLDAGQVDTPMLVACLVRRLMAKRPDERVQTPGELAELLEEIQNNPGLVSMGSASTIREKPAPRSLAQATVTDAGSARSATGRPVEPCATIATLDEPLVFSSSEILLDAKQGRTSSRNPKRRWTTPLLLVSLTAVIGAMAAVVGGHGSRPQAGTAPPADERQTAQENTSDSQWQELQTRVRQRKGDPDELRRDLVNFRSRQPNGPHAHEVARLIAQIPSRLDLLEWTQTWPAEKAGPRPPELVAIFGPGSGPVRTLAFSPDQHFLVAGGDKQVRYWNIARLGPAGGRTPINFPAHAFQLSRVAFAPDGRHFASACLDGTCKVWDTKEPGCVLALKPQHEGVTAVAFSPDGKTLATAGRDGKVRLWDRAAGELRHVIDGKAGPILCLAFSPDGRFVFWGGENHQVRWGDIVTRKTADQNVFTKAIAWVNVLAFHPSGQQLVLGGGGDGTLYLCRWDGQDLTCQRPLKHHRGGVRDLAFSPDGAGFLSAGQDKSIRLCDGHTGALLKSWEMHFVPSAVAFAPDGRHFAAGNAPPATNRGSVFLFRVPASVRLASR